MLKANSLIRAILTMTALSLLLAGCGLTSSGQPNASSTDKVENAGQIVLSFWFPGTDQVTVNAVKASIETFEEQNPNIKVNLTSVPWDQYFQKLAVAYSGGTQPDVHGLGFGQLISTVDQGKYLNLQPYIDKDQWEGTTDFYPDILKAGQWENGQYGLLIPDLRPLAWRKDYLAEAGLDPESPPQTLDELFQYADRLKVVQNGQTVRSGLDIQTSNGEQSYLSLLLLYGENFYDKEGNPTFDSETSIALVEKLVELYKARVFTASNQQQTGGTPFAQGQAAMAFVSPSNTASLIQSIGKEQVDWALPPAGPNGERTSLMLGTFLTAAKASKHPEEAWTFIKFWFSPDNQMAYTSKTGALPPLQSIRDEYLTNFPQNQVIYEAMNDAQGYIASKYWSVNIKYLRTALEEAYNGSKSAEDALTTNAELARDEIKSIK
ncbi:ABC transporter substrate-binding protein [Paenibacillus sp. JJ-223]|uniref:ABC transporter substrate-binding protein n=1 Tax=Paenibacillus sp. JJ-223 TaxID=2905647 RepID=UPI001F38A5F7|nr:ABC transporter substrate-binding protein [Paenibacillus sp. JJ-223]CAH1227623.1 hypothetical protein PAECIP111890_06142 [Paenibacillus sp. JJ-223]